MRHYIKRTRDILLGILKLIMMQQTIRDYIKNIKNGRIINA